MKIQINLATRPFVELRPLFARLRIVMAVLALVAAGLGFALHSMSTKAADAQQKMATLKDHVTRLQDEKIRDEARMRQPQNEAVLERSRFLNEVFARKSFSWTAVMMDLEDVLPAGVQVTSIEPSITPDGDVNIRLKVSGDRDRAVQLVRNLETSKRFLAPRLSDESVKTQTEGPQQRSMMAPAGVEFDILAGYNPLPPKPKADEAKDAKGSKDTGSAKPAAKSGRPSVKTVKTASPAATKASSAAPKTALGAAKTAGAAKPAPGTAKRPAAPAAGGKR